MVKLPETDSWFTGGISIKCETKILFFVRRRTPYPLWDPDAPYSASLESRSVKLIPDLGEFTISDVMICKAQMWYARLNGCKLKIMIAERRCYEGDTSRIPEDLEIDFTYERSFKSSANRYSDQLDLTIYFYDPCGRYDELLGDINIPVTFEPSPSSDPTPNI